MEALTDFIFLGSKVTVDSDCSHEIKRRSLEEKLYKSRQCIKKQRHHFADKVNYSESCGFSTFLYGCESWSKRRLSAKELMVSNCAGEHSFFFFFNFILF